MVVQQYQLEKTTHLLWSLQKVQQLRGRVEQLVKGMVIAIRTVGGAVGAATYGNVIVRVETGLTQNSADTSFTGKVISVSSTSNSVDVIADTSRCPDYRFSIR